MLKKIIALFTLIAFVGTSCIDQTSLAYAAETFGEKTKISLPELNIPADLGRVEGSFQGDSGKFLVFIQDAHSSLEAQFHIAGLIRQLVEQHDFKNVFEEGYEGKVPSDEFFGIPDPKLKKQVSRFFLDHLRIGGAEYAHINRRKDFQLTGAEDLKKYLADLAQYEKASRLTPLIQKDLATIEAPLHALESRLFPKNFQEGYRLKKRFYEGELSFGDFLKRWSGLPEVRAILEEAGFSEKYPQLSRLILELKTEGRPREDAKKNTEKFSWDAKTVFTDLERLENAWIARELKDKDARKLYSYLDSLETLKLLSSLRVSQEEFDFYRKKLARLQTRELLTFIARYFSKPILLSDLWEEWIRETVHFYSLAEDREIAVEKILDGNWDKAVLVFGGFHRQGIEKALRKKHISYMVICPKISRPDPVHEQRYEFLMSGALYGFEKGGRIPQAAKAPSLYLRDPRVDQRTIIRNVTLSRRPLAAAKVTLKKKDRTRLLYDDRSLQASAQSLGALLQKVRNQPVLTEAVIQAYIEALKTREVRDLAGFFHEILSALVPGIENDALRVETLARMVEVLKASGKTDEAMKEIFASLKMDREANRLIRNLYDRMNWGVSPHHDFLYRDTDARPFARIVPKAGTLKPEEIFKRLRVHFGYTEEEMLYFFRQLFPEKEASSWTLEDWERLYRALREENRTVQESRLGGFRRVRGIQRSEDAVKRLLSPDAEKIIARLTAIYGFSRESLEQMIREEWGEESGLQSLNGVQWRLVQDRLHAAGKRYFESQDRRRYTRQDSFLLRVVGKPFAYWKTLREKGLLAFLWAPVNDVIGLFLGIFVRWPLHLLEIFFFGYYRTEFLYEHIHANKDFLGQARSQAVIRHALRDLKNGKRTLSDRLNSGVPGYLNKALDRFLLGSLFKATLRFLVRRMHIALISVIAVGLLANLGAPVLSMGWVLSAPVLAQMFSGVWGLGSVFGSLATVPILGNLAVPVTIGSVSQSLILAAALVAPRVMIQRYQQRRLAKPESRRVTILLKVLFLDVIFSPGFWKQVLVVTVGMMLVGAEISAIVQYAAAMDLLIFGKEEEIELSPENLPHAVPASHPLHSFLSGKVKVDGVDHELQGPALTRAVGLVEGDALHWGHQILDGIQNRLGFNLSDHVFHQLGGDPQAHASDIMQMAHLLAQVRTQLAYGPKDEGKDRVYEQKAAILESVALQDQERMKFLAFELAHQKPEDAVRLISLFRDETVGRIAREYSKKEFKMLNPRTAVLMEALKEYSPEKYAAFKLSYLAGKIEFEPSEEALENWVRAFQEIAGSEKGPSRPVLRAVVSTLDNLEPKVIAVLLERAARPEYLEKVLAEAAFVPITRKERLIRLLREKGAKAGAPVSIDRPVGPWEDAQMKSARNIFQDPNGLSYPVGESADVLQALLRYAQASQDPDVIERLEKDFDRFTQLQLSNGAFLSGSSDRLEEGKDSLNNGMVELKQVPGKGGSSATEIREKGSSRSGAAVSVAGVMKDGKKVDAGPMTVNSKLAPDTAAYQKDLAAPGTFLLEWKDSVERGKHGSRHSGTFSSEQDGDYAVGIRLDILPSKSDDPRFDQTTAFWFPQSGERKAISQTGPLGPVDITSEFKANGSFVLLGYDKATVLSLDRFPERVEKVELILKEIGGKRVIEEVRVTVKYQGMKAGQKLPLPGFSAANFWVPMVSPSKALGGDGDALPDDLQAILPLWKQMMDAPAGQGLIYRTDEGYASAGLTLFKFSDFFSARAEKARKDGDMNAAAKYEALAAQAKEKALKTADYSYRVFRGLANQEEHSRAYANGHGYADMIELFERAYEVTGHDRWYEAFKHAADNVLQNQVLHLRKVMPQYEEKERDHYVLSWDGGSADLFDAIEKADPRLQFAVTRAKIPAFEVGFNKELGQNVIAKELDVIREVVVKSASGEFLDRLTFHYDSKGVLTSIKGESGKLQSSKETIPVVKSVQVYQQDLKTGIPFGMTYDYVYNAAGRLQYIVKKDRVTIENRMVRHPVNAILKDASGRALLNIDIPQGLRPDHGNVLAHEELKAEKSFDVLGRTLRALHRVKLRAEAEKDWKLAANTRIAAAFALFSLFDTKGNIQTNGEGLFFLYDHDGEEVSTVRLLRADANDQAQLLAGLAPWVQDLEQARELYLKGKEYFDKNPEQGPSVRSLLLLAEPGTTPSGGTSWSDSIPEEFRKEFIRDFTKYLRYAENTANFKFARVETRKISLDEELTDAVFLHWEPVPQAMWYLVREYRKTADGGWQTNKKSDRWVRSPFLAIEDPSGVEKKYVVAAFTADPIFESYGPFHGVHSLSSEGAAVEKEKNPARPGTAHLVVPERHLVKAHEEWIELGKIFDVVAREMKKFPHARGAEWEIATDKHFKNIAAKFKTEKDIPRLFLKGLPDGNYYIRVRLWSDTQESLSFDWKDFGSKSLKRTEVPEAVVNEDKDFNGIKDAGETDLNNNGVFDRVALRDGSVITWTPAKGAHFYKISVGYRDGELIRFLRDEIIVSSPFVNVREFTSKPVNWIEITPYTAHPEMGGIAGPASGKIDLSEIKGAETTLKVEGFGRPVPEKQRMLGWQSVPGAKMYRIDTLTRGLKDEPAYESFWAPEFALRYELQKSAKFVRIQAWTDHPEKGGKPLTEYTEWMKLDAELKTPAPVKRESVSVSSSRDKAGREIPVLSFDRVPDAQGYYVTTRNHRGGVYDYWVPQPAEGSRPSVKLSMDADIVKITPATERVGGLLGPSVEARVEARVPGDEETAPFLMIREEEGKDSNANGRIDPDYFYYDLAKIRVDKGVKAYIQYATQFKNQAEVTYGPTNGNIFYPLKNADRVRARIVRLSEQGDMVVSDWSSWKEVQIRIATPPVPAEILQEGKRTLVVKETPPEGVTSKQIAGYQWETRVDLDDPREEALSYRTTVKRHNGTIADPSNKLLAGSPAKWARVKTIILSDHGEISSAEWSEWKPVDVETETFPTVENIRVDGDRTLVFSAHSDVRVNGYYMEFSNDPHDNLQPRHTYTQRVIREKGKLIRQNNSFEIPVQVRFVRVTPMMMKSDDDKVLGTRSEWVPIEVKNAKSFPRMNEPVNHGRLLLGQKVEGAEYYRIQTRDREGNLRDYMSKSPWTVAMGHIVAYRMQPVVGEERNGQFVTQAEGEWTSWKTVREVTAPKQPPSPDLFLKRVQGIEVIGWNAEYYKEEYGITKYSYVIQYEDEDGNRTTTDMITDARIHPVGFNFVRARIKAVKIMTNPQGLDVVQDSESDWSPWRELRPVTKGPEGIRPNVYRVTGGTMVAIPAAADAGGYEIEWQYRSGQTGKVFHLAKDLKGRFSGELFLQDITAARDPVVRVRVQAFAKGSFLGPRESPLYDHGWVDVPGFKLELLQPPDADGRRPAALPGRVIALVKVGFDERGHIYYLGHERYSPPRVSAGYSYTGYIAVEESKDGNVQFRRSPVSDLTPARAVAPRVLPEVKAPVENEFPKEGVLTWDPVLYQLIVREKDKPEKTPVLLLSENEYAPDAALPRGKEAYDIEAREIIAYEVVFEDREGNERVIRTNKNFINLGDVAAGDHERVYLRYLVKGDFLGVHGDWSDTRGLVMKHEEEVVNIRAADDKHMRALFKDGTRVFFSKENGKPDHALVPGPGGDTRLKAEEIPQKYILPGKEIFDRGEKWVPITTENLDSFNAIHYKTRRVMQNETWRVTIPHYIDEKPFFLLGMPSSGSVHLNHQGQHRIIPNAVFSLASKRYENTNPGSLEAKWSSGKHGLDVYTRKYLLDGLKAGVMEVSFGKNREDLLEDSTFALRITPEKLTGKVRVIKRDDMTIFHFANGQFTAVPTKDLAGWYLGPKGREAEEDPSLKNDLDQYEGTTESAVIYLKTKTSRFAKDQGPQGVFNPELGDELNRIFIVSGQAGNDEILDVITLAQKQIQDYEKAFLSFAKHGSKSRRFPQEMLELLFKKQLSGSAWRTFPDGTGTYWEMMGVGDNGPANASWTNASWTGNSSLMQQLNIRVFRSFLKDAANEKDASDAAQLLNERIIPNADWIHGHMQTPTDSFYMKTGNSMRFLYSEGQVLMDNQLMSAILSQRRGIPLMRGYEPLDAFTIAGSGFEVETGGRPVFHDLRDPSFDFRLDLPEDGKFDPSQPELEGKRLYERKDGSFGVREAVVLKKGEYGVRYSLDLEAKKDLQLKKVAVALSHLDADQHIDRNPEGFPGFQGENGLLVPGVEGVFRARELFEKGGLSPKLKGQWVDLMTLLEENGQLTPRGQVIRKALKEIGAIGIMGWDKGGFLYMKEGIDYEKGYRVMVKVDENDNDADADRLLEFTDLRVEIPVEEGKQNLKAGEHYRSPEVHFTNFWVRLSVTDPDNVPEDLKHMVFDWMEKIDMDRRDSLSMESDYAYTESAMALWETAHLMLDLMEKAEREGNAEDAAKYKKLARTYSLAAMRATLASRDTDKSVYDIETGTVRQDVMNSKGVMRFYGTYTVLYGMARDFKTRLAGMEGTDLFTDENGNAVSMETALVEEARAEAEKHLALMRAAANPKDRARHKVYFEIYWGKVARWEAFQLGIRPEVFDEFMKRKEKEMTEGTDETARQKAAIELFHAEKQRDYLRVLGKYSSYLPADAADYWSLEILWSAERILELQEKNPERPNYGGFYQNEQPSKMQLDDNGTKLWALRVAYEFTDAKIKEILSEPGLRTAQLPELTRLYERRKAYAQAARLNIHAWARVDERDGHLYGWESHEKTQDFDTQRTEYGNAMYRLHGLGSWMDLVPEARKKFDESSRQHMEERPDGTRNFSPRGFKMYVSYDNPGNGNDTSTEVAPTELMAYLSRSQGGAFRKDPLKIRLVQAEENAPVTVTRRDYSVNFLDRKELLALFQLAVEVNVLWALGRGFLRLVRFVWNKLGRPLKVYSFAAYTTAVVVLTALMGYGYVDVHDLERTNPGVLIFMAGLSFYAMKNVAETLVRYFKMGMFRDADRVRGNSKLDAAPFHQSLPMHLSAMLSVPLYTTGGKDARISHGEAGDPEGAFQNAVMKNLGDEPGLLFHLNDQSPDREGSDGVNPKVFHENYIRDMIERYGPRFVYTHQAGNAEKKMGAVQASDSFWYALRGSILSVQTDLWASFNDEQKRELKEIAYGRSFRAVEEEFSRGGAWDFPEDGLKIRTDENGALSVEYHGSRFDAVPVPGQIGDEVKLEFKVKRKDDLTALMPVWLRRNAEGYEFYYHNEDPDGNNVLIVEEMEQKVSSRKGLLPLEKEAMIEAEARALLYRFWASEYGGTMGGEATRGKADTLFPELRQQVRTTLGENTDRIFGWDRTANREVPGGFAERFSRSLVAQSTDYFDKAKDVLSALPVTDPAALFPDPFDPAIRAWTDLGMLSAPVEAENTVPFEIEVGKRAVPGVYYHFDPAAGKLVPYENPALRLIDETAVYFEKLMADKDMDAYAKKKKAEDFLRSANPVLKNIREIRPVVKRFQVRENPLSGRTEVLEEQWILYEYSYEDGRKELFFRPERKQRFDTLLGHLPTVGPLHYLWRFDNDTSVDILPGEKNTLTQGALRAGHPHYQPVLDPESGQTVLGYGGMVLPMRVGNGNASYWTELEGRNRDKISWDLEGQWEGFGETQYTGKGIENLESAERAKAHSLPKGFYLSHDMLEAGYSGPGLYNMTLKKKLAENGLLEAFLAGSSHSKFENMIEFVWNHFNNPKEDGRLVFTKYGRSITQEEFKELLSPGARGGGMGLLSGMGGYEDYFESHRDTLFKIMGQWKKGDFQWWHAAWLGLDIRGLKKTPGAMPGYTVSERRTLEREAGTEQQNVRPVMTGQEYKPNPLNDAQKYFLSRTVEEDQRGAVMFVWLMASVVLSVLDHHLYTLINVPVLSYFLLFGSVLVLVGIMKFSKVIGDIRREGLTVKNAKQLAFAVTDTLLESFIVSGINLWKAWSSTLRLIFRVPGMRWITGAQLGEKPTVLQTVREYGVGMLLGFSLIGFIIAFHPTLSMLIFGGIFLSSLILGPVFAWIAAQEPSAARASFVKVQLALGLIVLAGFLLPYAGISYAALQVFLMKGAVYAGGASFIGLVSIAVIGILTSGVPALYRRTVHGIVRVPGLFTAVLRWIRGIFSLDPTLLAIIPLKKHFAGALQTQKFRGSSVIDYFLTRGNDPNGYFSAKAKGLGNLILTLSLWTLPLFFPQLFTAAVLGHAVAAIALKAFYLGLFFPIGFLFIDKILDPERPFRVLNPFDYLRALFHLSSALVGNTLFFISGALRFIFTALQVPYQTGTARVFVKGSIPFLLSKKGSAVIRTTAQFLKEAKAGTRKRFISQLSGSVDAAEKFMLLADSGLLDDHLVKELSDELFSRIERPEPRLNTPVGPDFDLDLNEGMTKKTGENEVKPSGDTNAQSLGAVSERTPADQRPVIFQQVQNLRGAVMIDARSFSKFSPAQREEVLKTILAGRARVVIYYKEEGTPDALSGLQSLKNVRLISEGARRALTLLAGEKNIVHLFDKEFDPRKEDAFAGGVERIKLFQQIDTQEQGLLTAALLVAQYGDTFHAFREENGVFLLSDRFLLQITQEFLAHEYIAKAA